MLGRPGLPAAVAAVVLDAGERRLAWGLAASGAAVVATDLGLWMPGAARIDWPDVERISWNRPLLTVLAIAPVEGAGDRRQVELVDGTDLPEVARSQVTASIGWSSHYRLPPAGRAPAGAASPGAASPREGPAGGVRIVGRRRPGQELLDWQVVYDRNTDPPDAQQRAQAEALLLDVRRTIG